MFAIIIAVGPGETECARTIDLVESIVAHEPTAACKIVVLDDAPTERDLGAMLRPIAGDRIATMRHMRRVNAGVTDASYTVLGPLCAGILQLLGWVADNIPSDQLRFVLKMDTDALVIAPFADKIDQILARDQQVGLIGPYRKTPNGSFRDFSHHSEIMRSMHKPEISWSRPRSILRAIGATLGLCRTTPELPARLSRVIGTARRHGYQYGEHCLGGAYALSGEFLRRLKTRKHLADASKWMAARCPEDPMLGMYVHAVGLTMADAVDDGEPFGIRYIGLPYEPAELLARGYSLIHSVKNDAHFTEAEIRDFFREQRETRETDSVPFTPRLELTLSAPKRQGQPRAVDVA